LRATVPGRLVDDSLPAATPVAFPELSVPFALGAGTAGAHGVPWPADITGAGWAVGDVEALLDLLPAAVAVWDDEFRNVFANRAALRWFGRSSREDVVGRSALELLGEEIFERNRPAATAALAGLPQQVDRTVVHPTGLRHVQASYLPRRRAGAVDGIYTFVVDVTARVEAELALQDARADLVSAQERQRIADELHNMVIQRLFAASLAASLPSAVTEAQLRSVQDGIAAALDELEAALSMLHEQVGLFDLLPALAQLVHDMTDPRGIETVIENVGSIEYVPPGVGSELLAVAHAALSNVIGHSAARKVVVTIAAAADEVWLRVVDDGRGLGRRGAGRGMADMRGRAERLGGTCTWRAHQPTGTVVDWRVPTPR